MTKQLFILLLILAASGPLRSQSPPPRHLAEEILRAFSTPKPESIPIATIDGWQQFTISTPSPLHISLATFPSEQQMLDAFHRQTADYNQARGILPEKHQWRIGQYYSHLLVACAGNTVISVTSHEPLDAPSSTALSAKLAKVLRARKLPQ